MSTVDQNPRDQSLRLKLLSKNVHTQYKRVAKLTFFRNASAPAFSTVRNRDSLV